MIIFSHIVMPIGVGDKRVVVTPGKGRYDIDFKDPIVARQLKVLQKNGSFVFREDIDGYIDGPKKNEGTVGATPETGTVDLSGGEISGQTADESSGRSAVSKRRNGDNKTSKIRRKSSSKKRAVAKAD